MKKIFIQATLIVSMLLLSCTKKSIYSVEGVVLNTNTLEPLDSVEVTLTDGVGVGTIIPSNGANVISRVYTNSEGKFKISIESKSNHAFLFLDKKGYEYINPKTTSDTRHYPVLDGHQNIALKMNGIAYFNAPFYKTSAPQTNQDSLKITLLSYKDLEDDLRSLGASFYKGKGGFYFLYEDFPVRADGDRYLRYKLEFTTDGVWQTKIDSVFLPTSLEVYRDTIYY
jgi:hypothetical protein